METIESFKNVDVVVKAADVGWMVGDQKETRGEVTGQAGSELEESAGERRAGEQRRRGEEKREQRQK